MTINLTESATSLEWETGEMRDLMKANILMGVTEPERILHVQAKEDEVGHFTPLIFNKHIVSLDTGDRSMSTTM